MLPRQLRSTGLLLPLLLLAAGCSASSSESSSSESELEGAAGSRFVDVRSKVFAAPLTSDALPQHPGLSPWNILTNLLGDSSRPSDGLSIHSRRILVDTSDERRPEPKWLHPRGACADARWTITEPSVATGLFAKGTSVPAIVRISSGDHVSEGGTNAGGRILGFAVKLFPTTSVGAPAKTTNIIMLDQYGFERSKRQRTFVEDEGAPVYFTNVAPAKSELGKFLSGFFDRFDKPNFSRPLYATARAQVDRRDDLPTYQTPYEIRFQLHAAGTPVAEAGPGADFRTELLALNGRGRVVLDIILESMDGTAAIKKPIGQLTLESFVVSDYCDLSLHFHHDSLEDQLHKYEDYAVVRDLLPTRP